MTTWKVLLVLAVLALPLGYVVADVGEGAEEPAPRPAIVLPVGASGETSTRPDKGTRSPSKSPSPAPSPSPERSDDLCRGDGDDDRRDDDDDDDDGIDVVRPCPDDFGDDDDDDDRDDD